MLEGVIEMHTGVGYEQGRLAQIRVRWAKWPVRKVMRDLRNKVYNGMEWGIKYVSILYVEIVNHF